MVQLFIAKTANTGIVEYQARSAATRGVTLASRCGRLASRFTSVLLVVFSLWLCACQAKPKPESRGGPPPAAPVVLSTVEQTSLVVERTYLGEAVARSDAALSAAESARVRKVHVVEGDRVEAGELLVELDDRLARAEFSEAVASKEQAEVERQHAEREAERFEALKQEDVVSTLEANREADEAERLRARVDGVQATLNVRGERLSRHRIIAPFGGVVARRLVDPGDWLSAGEPAVQLLSAGHQEVLVRVPESLLDELATLQKLELGSGERRVPGKLSGIVDALDPSTRTALLRVEPGEIPEWLRSGASVDVSFYVQQSGGWVVPRDALVFGVGGVRVVKVVEGKAMHVDVKELAVSNQQALVAGELAKGDAIVVKGNERLRPGQAVTTRGAMTGEPPTAPPATAASSRAPAASSGALP